MFGMGLIDILASIAVFVGSWAIPANTNRYAYQPMGNTTTCNVQAFFLVLGNGSLLYNFFLMIYYLLYIKYSYKEEDFHIIEPIMHFISWGWGMSIGTAGILLNLFHNSTVWCFVAQDEIGAGESPSRTDAEIVLYRWVFTYMAVWFAIVGSAVVLVAIYIHIRRLEKETSWLVATQSKTDGNQHNMSRKMAWQASLYMAAFLATWLFPSLTRLIEAIRGQGVAYFPILVCFMLLLPLQGFFNVLVYSERSYRNWGKKHPHLQWFEKVWIIFSGDSEEEAARMSLKREQSVLRKKNLTNTTESNVEDDVL